MSQKPTNSWEMPEWAWHVVLFTYEKITIPMWRTILGHVRPKYIAFSDPLEKYSLYEHRASQQRTRLCLREDADKTSPPYRYAPLPAQHIRLLHVQAAASSSDPVRCSLSSVCINDGDGDDEGVEFEALSYSWGDPREKYWVTCDGAAICVTRNLMAALQQLRRSDGRPRTLWVDAVCINQEDVPERGQQVQLMAQIYHRARRVVVWLGEAHSDSDRAFQLIRRLAPAACGTSLSSTAEAVAVKPATAPAAQEAPTAPEAAAASASASAGDLDVFYDKEAWIALDALYWRPWFIRVWVIQEVAVSRSAIVMCGPQSESFDTFCAVTNYIKQSGLSLLVEAGSQRIRALMMTRLGFQQKADSSLLSLLVNFRMYQATNAVDKVYALLNLATDNQRLRPDYGRPAWDVYNAVARVLLASSLLVLSFHCDPWWQSQADRGGLASWAPDWSRQPRETALLSIWRTRPWRAGGDGPHVVRFSPGDGRTMYVEGRVLDRLTRVGEGFIRGDIKFSPIRKYSQNVVWALDPNAEITWHFQQRRWRSWERLVHRLKSYPATGEDISTVFQKILIADTDVVYTGPGPQPSLQAMFDAFRKYEWHASAQRPSAPEGSEEYNRYVGYAEWVVTASSGRTMFSTQKGYAGLSPYSSQPGDYVVLFHGGKTPYVLRKTKPPGHYIFIGEAYLHGFMDGEGIRDEHPVQEFAVV